VVTVDRGGPGITRKGEDRRAAILDAAAELFSEQGYRGASLASVAAAVGLTQPGLLHYFPSKEALLLALLENRYHLDGRRLTGALVGDGLSLLEALQGIVDSNQGSRSAVRLFTVLVAESISAQHPAHEHFRRRYGKVRRRLESILRDEQRAGRIRTDVDLAQVVSIVVAVMDGLQSQWLIDPALDMSAVFRLFSQLLTGALAPDRTERVRDSGVPADAGVVTGG